jgi:hypothetical protein
MSAGLFFLEIGHAQGCPGRYLDGEGCTCSPVLTMHASMDRFIAGEQINRAARRKAAREAEKAMRKAARKGAQR